MVQVIYLPQPQSLSDLKCKGAEKHGLTMYPRCHVWEDLAQNLLLQMPVTRYNGGRSLAISVRFVPI